jgi:shikimate kinase
MNAKTQPMNLSAPIVLIGLMGAGKSTIGKRLAKALELPFADSDQAIEESAGCSISDLFAMHGEAVFRDLEKRVIQRLLSGDQLVLATGGGAWMQPWLREFIHSHAVTVWLRADIEVLLDRVSKRSHRPLLEQGDKRTILSALMAERYPVYAEADITIDSPHGSQEDIVKKIIHSLQNHPKSILCRHG